MVSKKIGELMQVSTRTCSRTCLSSRRPQAGEMPSRTNPGKSGRGLSNKKSQGLGRAIIRQQFGAKPDVAEMETERGKHRLRSVTQTNDLEELMSNAMLANTDFTATRGAVVVLNSEARSMRPAEVAAAGLEQPKAEGAASGSEAAQLPVPRRPSWHPGQASEDLDRNEKVAFLEWRRDLALLEDEQGEVLTPFEKNLEVWRQLWRVLERSQLVLQIVDARNPLLFRCADLERYAKEIDPRKRCMLLINKADLLSKAQRARWADYLRSQKIEFLWWSAAAAQSELEEEERRERHVDQAGRPLEAYAKDEVVMEEEEEDGGSGPEGGSGPAGGSEEEEEEEVDEDKAGKERSGKAEGGEGVKLHGEEGDKLAVASPPPKNETVPMAAKVVHTDDDRDMWTRILRRDELIRFIKRLSTDSRCRNAPTSSGASCTGPLIEGTVGLVGYPNVGKSSTVNVLVAEKKTSVSATPGKTKHFQTLLVPNWPGLQLCDCPGLVFPSIAGSKAQMVCDGILPIDQMRDYMAPIRYLVQRISREAVFQTYGLKLRTGEEIVDDPEAPELARELLMAHAISRGFMTATKGGPDESRSARIILKDLVNAKLLYCTPPPSMQDRGDEVARRWEAEGRAVTQRSRGARPQAATVERYLEKVRNDYSSQETVSGRFGGKRGTAARGSVRGMQWRPAAVGPMANAVPDRMMAKGSKAAVSSVHTAHTPKELD